MASTTSRYLQVGRFLGPLRGPCQDKAYHCKDVLNRRQPVAENFIPTISGLFGMHCIKSTAFCVETAVHLLYKIKAWHKTVFVVLYEIVPDF